MPTLLSIADKRGPSATECLSSTPPELPWPLTPAQRQLLAVPHPGTETGVARHWEQAVWHDFSLPRLHRAIAEVVHRHPLLRLVRRGEHEQEIAATVIEPVLRVTDAVALEESEQGEHLARERATLCLARDGSLAQVCQLHALIVSPHTAVITVAFARAFCDRVTIRLLLDELRAAYQDIRATSFPGDGSMEAFRAHAERGIAAAERPVLPDLPPGPELPAAPAASGRAGRTTDRVSIRLDAATWAQLRQHLTVVCPTASTAALVFAAAGSVLARWCPNRRFSLQLDRDMRALQRIAPHAEGHFSGRTVAVIDETASAPFAERVDALQRLLDAPPADQAPAGFHPTVALSMSPAPPVNPSPPPEESDLDPFVFVGASRPDVNLELQAEETTEGGLVVHCDFVREAFAANVVIDLREALERWLQLLAGGREIWAATPAWQMWSIFPAGQMRRRCDVNATGAPLSDDRLYSGFLRQVAAAPERIAVITPDRTFTYAALHGYAIRLALELRQRGVKRNELVAIAAEKGWEQVAAALGITMAGAAYLPVDVELPDDRFRHLLECGEARVVITQSHLRTSLAIPAGVDCIALDTLAPVAAGTPPPDPEVAPDDLAYVIFTSGSTGTPKGVMIDHRGAVNTILDMNTRFRVQPADRVLALSRLSFDLSVYDIFGLLAAGGALVVPSPTLVRDPAHWVELMRTHAVTIWNTVPALMQLLVDYATETSTPPGQALRLAWMSGDWIPLSLPGRIKALLPGVETVSLGGATEASIWSILFPITTVDPAWRSIPYGRPMVNQTFYVLAENLAPCPDHVTGELYIGGVGVARGYWKDEEKTNARFLVHPHTGERLYRTGDLGRFLPDGTIEFLGRSDFQVKIRGFRIEPGEIEAVLATEPRVRAAVVVAQGETDHDRRLVAHVVPTGETPVTALELQQFLRGRLPAYMVPTAIAFLDRLPLTANGKVDLRALPALAGGDASPADRPPHVEPTTEIEEILRDLWRPILGVSRIGIHDDFFALGGNSLSGTRMIIRLRAAFHLHLATESLYAHPTIARLARVVEQLLLVELEQEEARRRTGHEP